MAVTTLPLHGRRSAAPQEGGARDPALRDPEVHARIAPTLAGRLVTLFGGRFSTELGIDLARCDADVERWFLAASLCGNPISWSTVRRTVAAFGAAGVWGIGDVEDYDHAQLVALLDAGGYARYDDKTARRLHALAAVVRERYGGTAAEIGRRVEEPSALEGALDALPGWGPVTRGLFLRELRGVWPGALPALDRRADAAGRHLGLLFEGVGGDRLALVAALAHCADSDLESALVRVSLAHRRLTTCAGGRDCAALRRRTARHAPRTREVDLPGGRRVRVRPMRADDAPGILTLYEGLGERDVYRRFFSSRPPSVPFVAKMAAISARGGIGLVATVPRQDRAAIAGSGGTVESDGSVAAANGEKRERIVAEATCEPLGDGDGELGITVAAGLRGWLGPFLLDALLEDAAASWVANLQADVLFENFPMLATLRRRGMVVMRSEPQPALLRVAVGTTGDVPSWPVGTGGRRVVVEVQGARWDAEEEVRKAGFHVVGCAGPPGGWTRCPPMRGEPCPLAADAAFVVHRVSGEASPPLLAAHRRVHPWVRVCAIAEGADGQLPGVAAAAGSQAPRDGAATGTAQRGEQPDNVVVVPRCLPGPVVARILADMAAMP